MSGRIIGPRRGVPPRPWLDQAECLGMDPELFFPGQGDVAAPSALEACRICPVAAECLEWALEARELNGIYAGTTGRERQRMLRQRQRGAA